MGEGTEMQVQVQAQAEGQGESSNRRKRKLPPHQCPKRTPSLHPNLSPWKFQTSENIIRRNRLKIPLKILILRRPTMTRDAPTKRAKHLAHNPPQTAPKTLSSATYFRSEDHKHSYATAAIQDKTPLITTPPPSQPSFLHHPSNASFPFHCNDAVDPTNIFLFAPKDTNQTKPAADFT